MRFKLIIIDIVFGLLITGSCNLNEKGNKYIFPSEENINYFIVNVHNAPEIKTENKKDTFDFSSSRLIVLNNANISEEGLFFIKINGKVIRFNPNEIDKNKFKICYFQNIKNVGFSVSGNAEKYGVQPQKEYENLHLKYDFLYFRVGKACIPDSVDYYDDLFFLLTDYFGR